jgi:hypothetical protein
VVFLLKWRLSNYILIVPGIFDSLFNTGLFIELKLLAIVRLFFLFKRINFVI